MSSVWRRLDGKGRISQPARDPDVNFGPRRGGRAGWPHAVGALRWLSGRAPRSWARVDRKDPVRRRILTTVPASSAPAGHIFPRILQPRRPDTHHDSRVDIRTGIHDTCTDRIGRFRQAPPTRPGSSIQEPGIQKACQNLDGRRLPGRMGRGSVCSQAHPRRISDQRKQRAPMPGPDRAGAAGVCQALSGA